MIYKTDQRWQDWVLVWVSFIIVTAIFHEQWLRLLTVGGVLLLRPLYWYLWQRTIDVPGLLAVSGIAVLAFLTWLHPGLPYFLFAAIVFLGFVIVPIYVSIRRTTQQDHAN